MQRDEHSGGRSEREQAQEKGGRKKIISSALLHAMEDEKESSREKDGRERKERERRGEEKEKKLCEGGA